MDRSKIGVAGMFVQHGSILRGFFSRRGANEDAEDLVQEAYLRLLRAHQQPGVVIDNPEAYLYTVAANLAHEQHVRRRQAPASVAEFEQVIARMGSNELVEDGAEREQRRRHLEAVLNTLPERTRAVLVMQYREGLSYRQIIERLGVSTHMIKKHVVRGLASCRLALAEQEQSL